jgi:hypothetical protein
MAWDRVDLQWLEIMAWDKVNLQWLEIMAWVKVNRFQSATVVVIPA